MSNNTGKVSQIIGYLRSADVKSKGVGANALPQSDILKELLFQQKLNAAGIKKSYVKTALSDVEFKVSSCNKRTIRISSIGDNS